MTTICRNLRWKGHADDLSEARLLEVIAHNHVPYACLRTAQPWGIDDEPAVPERCTRGRACFRARDEVPDDDA